MSLAPSLAVWAILLSMHAIMTWLLHVLMQLYNKQDIICANVGLQVLHECNMLMYMPRCAL